MKFDPHSFEMPWRPNYEFRAIVVWVLGLISALGAAYFSSMPTAPFYWMMAICGVMISIRIFPALKLSRLQKALKGRKLEFITLPEVAKRMDKLPGKIWLGTGFNWETRHAQRVYEILKRDWATLSNPKKDDDNMGQPWIHGVEPKENVLSQDIVNTQGHTLIAGTTGAGKTRLFDLLVTQAILRDEAVIILDPKGDKEMMDNARRACEALGEPERFVSFHPAYPDESHRIDPLKNFARGTEIASRLAALIPSEGGGDPFKAFGWQALNNIVQGLLVAHDRPDLVLIRRFLENGSAGLVTKSVQAYAERVFGDSWRDRAEEYLQRGNASKSKEKMATQMMRFYDEVVQGGHANSDLEGLLSMFQHDSTHFSKMVASLLPIMNMLTSGDLSSLLSPNSAGIEDQRPVTDMATIINNAQVAYVGLDSLTDGMVGSAIGSIFLADLTAVAGDRYNFGVNNRPVNIFVDEASEIVNDGPFLQIANKGRGSAMRLWVATQTISDFTARLGGEEKALQVLGNMNNLISLRVMDEKTQEYITSSLPKTRLKSVSRSQMYHSNSEIRDPVMHARGGQSEGLSDEEGDMFPSALLGMLPNLEYIAKVSGGRIIKGRIPILVGDKSE